MRAPYRRSALLLSMSGLLPLTALTAQTAVDLNTWSAQSYPAVAGFGAGVWTVAPGGGSVRQSVNGQPTLFASDFNARGSDISGRIRVESGAGDDDFIGFALGYKPGDIANASANYLLIDWKAVTQSFDFGAPSTTPGTTAQRGLAVSRVTGVPTADEFWGHTNFASDAGGGVEELQRGATLGSAGWARNVEYEFRFVFTASALQVFVNGTKEIDILGSFADGSLAFYNFSQAGVVYSAFTRTELPPTDPGDPSVVPEPSTYLLFATGLGLLAVVRRRRRVNG